MINRDDPHTQRLVELIIGELESGPPGTEGANDAPRGHIRTDGTRKAVGLDADKPAALGPASRVHMTLADLARYLDLPDPSFEGFLGWVLDLREEIGIPPTLADLGVAAERIPVLAPMAVADPTAATNPVPFDEAGATALYRRAIRGELAG